MALSQSYTVTELKLLQKGVVQSWVGPLKQIPDHINPRLPLKWPFGVHFSGTLMCAVIKVSNRNFLRLLRRASLRL